MGRRGERCLWAEGGGGGVGGGGVVETSINSGIAAAALWFSLPYRVSIALIGAGLYAGVRRTTQPSRLPPRGSREIIL